MSDGILVRVASCNTSAEIWKVLEVYFSAQIRAKVSQYKTQLRRLKKTDLTMNEYLVKIRSIIDLLELVGEITTKKLHIEAIFEGLPDEYELFELSTMSRKDDFSVDEIESLLLAQEARIEKKRDVLTTNQRQENSN